VLTANYAAVWVDHEWGEFFWRESQKQSGERTIYMCTFACVTSYGVFGYSWNSMGSPFAQFAAELGEDYLINKISGEMVVDVDGSIKDLLKTIDEHEWENEDAREAARSAVEDAEAEHSGERIVTAICESGDIPYELLDDWPLRTWNSDAVHFARKLWPAFVQELQK